MRNVAVFIVITTLNLLTGCATPSRLDEPLLLTASDTLLFEETTNTALESNPSHTSTLWRSQTTGLYGTTTPTQTIKIESPRGFCRWYTQQVFRAGSNIPIHVEEALACRKARLNWVTCGSTPQTCLKAFLIK